MSEHVADIWPLVDLFVFADGGNLPVAGGVLNQTRIFLRLLTAWRAYSARYKSNV